MIVIVLSVFWWLVALFFLPGGEIALFLKKDVSFLLFLTWYYGWGGWLRIGALFTAHIASLKHGNKLKVQVSWWKDRYSVACCSPVVKIIILISYDSYLPRAFAEFLFNRYADRYACMSKLQWTQKLLAWAISSFVKRVHVWPLLKRLKMSIVPRLQGEHKVPGQLKQK